MCTTRADSRRPLGWQRRRRVHTTLSLSGNLQGTAYNQRNLCAVTAAFICAGTVPSWGKGSSRRSVFAGSCEVGCAGGRVVV